MAHEQLVEQLTQQWMATTSDILRHREAYEGDLPQELMGMSLPPELRVLQTIVNWNSLVPGLLEERLDIEGFRIAGESGLDSMLADWWAGNNLDEESNFAHLDALVYGRAYICIGAREESEDDSLPLITVESPERVYADVDPRTGRVRSAIRFNASDPDRAMWTDATLMLPDATHFFTRDQGGWHEDEGQVIEHGLGEPPCVPLLNRARVTDRDGRSEMEDIMPLTSSASRAMTNLQGAQELLALPQRYIMGIAEQDFKDPSGNAKAKLEAYMSRIWAFTDPDAKAGQFPAASLDNFATSINTAAKLASSLSGVPLRFFGVVSEVNPSSAEAVRADETRLVKRCERKQRMFSGAWERAMRLAMLVMGQTRDDARRLEVKWRDPSTPTWSASAQAAVQLYQAGVIPRETAWDDLGYTAEQQRVMSEQLGSDPLSRFLESAGGIDGAGDEPGGLPGRAGQDLSQNPVGGGIAAVQGRE